MKKMMALMVEEEEGMAQNTLQHAKTQ